MLKWPTRESPRHSKTTPRPKKSEVTLHVSRKRMSCVSPLFMHGRAGMWLPVRVRKSPLRQPNSARRAEPPAQIRGQRLQRSLSRVQVCLASLVRPTIQTNRPKKPDEPYFRRAPQNIGLQDLSLSLYARMTGSSSMARMEAMSLPQGVR